MSTRNLTRSGEAVYTRATRSGCLWMRVSKAAAVAVLLSGGILASLISVDPAQTAHDERVLVVQGARIPPISAPPNCRGRLSHRGGKIVAVGEEGQVQVPAGAKIQDAT